MTIPKISEELRRYFIAPESVDEVFEQLSIALRMGLDFKTRAKVVNYLGHDGLMDLLMEPIPQNLSDLPNVLQEFQRNILDYSTNFSSPYFMAFPDSGNAIPAIAGALMASLINQNLINSKHCAPAATFAEIAVINWMRELIGYPVVSRPKNIFDVGGVVTSGGVLSNLTCLLLAREHCFPGIKDTGVTFNPSMVKVIVPDYINHYSIKLSLGWMGLGENNLLTIPSQNFRYDLRELEIAIEQQKRRGKVMAIVAYAGDSRSMTIDNFPAIAEIAHDHEIWFHIDACHGFQYAFSDKMRPMISGIELADSITLDPHKILFTPYVLSMALARDHEGFKAIASSSDLITKEDYAFGQMTPALGSRNFSSLKLWFLIKTLGRRTIGELIDLRHEMAQYLASELINEKNFVVLNNEVNINSVVFMYVPDQFIDKIDPQSANTINEINQRIQERLFTEGQYYVHTFSIPDLSNVLGCGKIMLHPLRYMCGNPLTEAGHIKELIGRIKEVGKEESDLLINDNYPSA